MKNDIPNEAEWERVKALGVRPDVHSPAQFARLVADGSDAAREYLSRQPDLAFSPKDISTVHFHLYQAVFPWAREFRTAQNEAQGSRRSDEPSIKPVDWRNVIPTLEATATDTREAFRTGSLEEKAHAIAMFLHGVTKANPFAFGSEPVGQLLMDEQSRRSLGVEVSGNTNPAELREGLRQIEATGDATRLQSHIIDSAHAADKVRIDTINRQMQSAETQLRKGLVTTPSPHVVHSIDKTRDRDVEHEP